MGPACEDPCVNGIQEPMDSGYCKCDPGWVGVGCDSECSFNGKIINGSCECYVGWRGEYCDIAGCPGIDVDCSGRGQCNSETHQCICNDGWTGDGCEFPDCPGNPDCFMRGHCNDTVDPPVCTNCEKGWMGPDCNDPCTFGNQVPMDSGNCVCDPCYSGRSCNSECMENGFCSDGKCSCDPGWWGELCEVPGCPGVEEDCSGNGDCNSALHLCFCYPGWKGDGCEIPDCADDCNNRGYCNGTDRTTPQCTDCEQGWMGHACEEPCVYGIQEPMDSGVCLCDKCYTGYGCNVECSGNGVCNDNNQCECFEDPGNSWFGLKCEMKGCPGEDNACNGHGDCNSASQKCTCYPGWTGDDCSIADCPGTPSCSGNGVCGSTYPRTCKCFSEWAGDVCDVPCVNGANVYGDGCICDACFTGTGCDQICNGNGECENDACSCDFDSGYKGEFCQIPGCPGHPTDCSGHGSCNLATFECICDPGWKGNGCHIPDCPGDPDCHGRGVCPVPENDDDDPWCDCNIGWMGDGCETPCVHGTRERFPNGTWICHCEPCFNGIGCDLLCSNHTTAQCIDGTCDCGFDGGRGAFCEVGGCPGDYGLDCSGHGECNSATGVCYCHSGWTGEGCEIPDCPGTPDCNDRGVCEPSDPPVCRNCTSGWMGTACEVPCIHGEQIPMDSGNCTCEPCYSGISCDAKCGGIGNCTDDGVCECPFEGGRGEFCTEPGCPGYGKDCTGHGTCILGKCLCNEGWLGRGCEIPDCPGDPNCNGRGTCTEDTPRPECID
ncbi:tenascin-X-like [Ptychodera flava]|uniref:tenascin-X-like n=1 Tax=Ptychodera flava TaxID=63121 RepID=UPI003969C50D